MSIAPAGMLRLPSERLDCPKVEPSQEYCPHWALVVAHQALREVYYLACDARHQLLRSGCFGVPSPTATHVPLRSAPKKVLVVRHGQGAHNRTIKNWGLVDPELTPEGEAQVADLHARLKQDERVKHIELIVVSPLTRAMQTATGGLDGCKAPYCMLPLLRERLGAPCDTGRTRTELLRCFPQAR